MQTWARQNSSMEKGVRQDILPQPKNSRQLLAARKERVSFLKHCSPWWVIHALVEDHTAKNVWSAQTGLDQGEMTQSWVRRGRRVDLWRAGRMIKTHWRKFSKSWQNVSLNVQRLMETLSYRNKPPVHSNKQCTKERERLFEKKQLSKHRENGLSEGRDWNYQAVRRGAYI